MVTTGRDRRDTPTLEYIGGQWVVGHTKSFLSSAWDRKRHGLRGGVSRLRVSPERLKKTGKGGGVYGGISESIRVGVGARMDLQNGTDQEVGPHERGT